jgi:hypothetical protein
LWSSPASRRAASRRISTAVEPQGRPIRESNERRSGIMELTEARALVKDKTDKDITVRHLISVEG